MVIAKKVTVQKTGHEQIFSRSTRTFHFRDLDNPIKLIIAYMD
jgi:hypothetical protein